MAHNSRTKNTLVNTAAGFAAKIINIITGLAMRWVFIYTLGAEYLGVKGLFTSVLTMLSFAELGMSGAIAYSMYKPVAQGDNRRVAALLNFYKTAYRYVAGVIMVLGLSLLPFMHIIVPPDKLSPDIYRQVYLIYILYVADAAVSYLLIYRSTLLTAHQEHRYVSQVQAAFSVLRVVTECIVLFVFKNFIVYLLLGICITRTQNWVVSRIAKKRYPEVCAMTDERLTREERRKLLGDIKAKMMYKVSNSLMNGCDNLVISAVFGSTWVGFVDNYTMVTKRINNLVNQFYSSATPSVGNLAASSDEQKQYTTFRVLQFMAFWMCCFATTSFLVLLNPFIRLWLDDKFVLSSAFVLVICFQFYINSMIHPVTAFRDSNGLFVQGRFRPVIMATLNIGLSVLFALMYYNVNAQLGIIGVKAATSIAQLMTMQWYDPLLIFRRVFKRPLKEYFAKWFGYISVTAISCALTWGLGQLTGDIGSRYVSFGVKMLLCILVPNGLIVLVFHKTEEFKGFLRAGKSLLKKKKGSKKALPQA